VLVVMIMMLVVFLDTICWVRPNRHQGMAELVIVMLRMRLKGLPPVPPPAGHKSSQRCCGTHSRNGERQRYLKSQPPPALAGVTRWGGLLARDTTQLAAGQGSKGQAQSLLAGISRHEHNI
jgi:hypothetical protein